jgi:hypothetical protein
LASDPTADLEKYLKSLPDKMVKQLSGAVKREADRLSDAQRQALRSLEKEPSGALEQSCTVEATDDPLTFIVQAGGDLTTSEVREGSGVEFDRALAFEFGTRHQPARGFFYPTYRAMQKSNAKNIS